MIIKCGICNNKIEVDDSIVDGQHVLCPFCGNKSAYSKPRRIELPTGIRRPQQIKGGASTESEGTPVKAEKPKLAIKRSTQGLADVDLNAQAIMRKMQEDEEAKKISAAKTKAARRQATRDYLIRKGIITVVILVVAIAGALWFMKRKAARVERERIERERIRLEQAEEQAQFEQARAETKKRQEQQAQEREELRRAKETERLNREQEYAKRKLADAAAKKENEAILEAKRIARDYYKSVMNKFIDVSLLPWSSLAKDKRPGKVDGKFTCACLGANGDPEVYEVESAATGELKVKVMSKDGNLQETDKAAFEERLRMLGGVVYNGYFAYVLTAKDSANSIAVPDDIINPAKIRLGETDKVISRMCMSTSRLAFEVRLNVKGRRDSISVKTVPYGAYVYKDDIDCALKAIAASSVKKPSAGRAKRRTVMMYDGRVIKRQMNGVTLVPYNPERMDATWNKLRDEADRQEMAANAGPSEEAMSKYEAAVDKKFQQLKTTSTMTIFIKDNQGN